MGKFKSFFTNKVEQNRFVRKLDNKTLLSEMKSGSPYYGKSDYDAMKSEVGRRKSVGKMRTDAAKKKSKPKGFFDYDFNF